MTKDEALAKIATHWWEHATPREIAEFQLREPLLCMPFGDFHKAVETVLGRGVFTHEFARPAWLIDEMEGRREPLDPVDSLRAIAPDKEVIVVNPEPESR